MSRLFAAALSVVVCCGILTAAAPGASAAPAAGQGRYCLSIVERIKADSPETKVYSRTCSNENEPGTSLPKGSKLSADGQRVIALDTSGYDLLVTFFQHEYYGGAYSTVGGRYGTCDTLGYGLSNLTYINNGVVYGISSYRLNGSCYRANYWTETGYDGYTKYKYGQNNPFVGVTWNDHLYSMQIRA